MITKQEYENAVEVIAQYREQQAGEKSKEIIEKNNPKVFEIIKELNKLGYANDREGQILSRWYDYYKIDFVKNNIVLQLLFNKKEIKFNLWFDNDNALSEDHLDMIYLCTIEILESIIEDIKKVIAKINCQWQELEPIMKKYDIKRYEEE